MLFKSASEKTPIPDPVWLVELFGPTELATVPEVNKIPPVNPKFVETAVKVPAPFVPQFKV